ncbi:MAG: universal stress protein [Chloroflexota bacterium]|nr:universal stress protein [Chloroflexota bacterium]
MRRVLVPLDGTPLAASILPEAKLVAGEGGCLILISDSIRRVSDGAVFNRSEEHAVQDALASLETQAEQIRLEGIAVETHGFAMNDPAHAIDVAARMYHADIVVCATHGRGPWGRMLHGGVVWRTLAHGPVPVLIKNVEASSGYSSILEPEPRILAPLDGSKLAERALPLAKELMQEWNASTWLVHVVSSYPVTGFPRTAIAPSALTDDSARDAAQPYLDEVAVGLDATTHQHVLFGEVTEQLVAAARTWGITHVVMTSHGRTGLARVALGSVADDLIQRLPCPIIIVPLHGSAASEQTPTAVLAGRM